MRTARPSSGRLLATSCAGILLLADASRLSAHAGTPCLRPQVVAAPPRVDGAVEPADGWGAPLHVVTLGGTACTAPVQRLFAVRTGGRTFVAVEVPESVADDRDTLLFFVDGNHGGSGAPDADDRAIRLVGFPEGTEQTPSGAAEVYAGTGTGWGPPQTFFPVRTSRTGRGPGGRVTVELELPAAAASVGFAVAFLSGDRQDCDGDFVGDSFLWPPALPFPIGPPPGLSDARSWGDLGCTPPTPPTPTTPVPRPTRTPGPLECRKFTTEETCRAQHPDCRWAGPTSGCIDI
jgi:hypothetical protein